MTEDAAVACMSIERVAEAIAHRRAFDDAGFRTAAARLGVDPGELEASLVHWSRTIADGLERGEVGLLLRFSAAFSRVEHDLRLHRPRPAEVKPSAFGELEASEQSNGPAPATKPAEPRPSAAATSAPRGDPGAALPTYLRGDARARPAGVAAASSDERAAAAPGAVRPRPVDRFPPSGADTDETQALPAFVPAVGTTRAVPPDAPAVTNAPEPHPGVVIREAVPAGVSPGRAMPLRATTAPSSDSVIARGARLPFDSTAAKSRPASTGAVDAESGAHSPRVSSGERGTVAATELERSAAPLPFAEKAVRPDEVDLSMFPIERYAELSVALADGEDRPTVLRRFVLTEAMWKAVAQAWAARIAGDPSLREAFDRAVREARSR